MNFYFPLNFQITLFSLVQKCFELIRSFHLVGSRPEILSVECSFYSCGSCSFR